jgi:hypothetical protein
MASNILTYLLVAVVALGALGFLYLLFGDVFLTAMLIFAVIGGVGCLHYFLWGRSMSAGETPADAAEPE